MEAAISLKEEDISAALDGLNATMDRAYAEAEAIRPSQTLVYRVGSYVSSWFITPPSSTTATAATPNKVTTTNNITTNSATQDMEKPMKEKRTEEDSPEKRNAYIRHKLLYAIGCFLTSEMLICRESVLAYVKAGLLIKRGASMVYILCLMLSM